MKILPALLALTIPVDAPTIAAAKAPMQTPGMVPSADPRATEAGRTILRQGGSATDAAMAMMLALTVVEPQSSGIGGGGFLVHNDGKTGRIDTVDGREKAPMAATDRRASRIRCSTSCARAPPLLTMKLAWWGEICAPPADTPFNPARSMARPGGPICA